MGAVRGTPAYDAIDRRCHTELGWSFSDASLLYPDATKRIVQDEVIRRWPSLGGTLDVGAAREDLA